MFEKLLLVTIIPCIAFVVYGILVYTNRNRRLRRLSRDWSRFLRRRSMLRRAL
jgi:hypothetical protein